MAPRCTGICAAWATIDPSGSNRAQEKSKALLHVGRVGRPLQGHAHLFGDGDEQVLEDFQADGVYQGAPPAYIALGLLFSAQHDQLLLEIYIHSKTKTIFLPFESKACNFYVTWITSYNATAINCSHLPFATG